MLVLYYIRIITNLFLTVTSPTLSKIFDNIVVFPFFKTKIIPMLITNRDSSNSIFEICAIFC